MSADPAVARWGDTFREGARLYHQGSFFAAHEAWELLWIAEREPGPKLLLQGLIQIAAGFHKYFAQGRPEAAARLLRRGIAKLVANDARELGLEAFCDAIRDSIELIERAGSQAPSAPVLRLSDVPRL